MGIVTKEQEREFEKRHIARQAERYLTTDSIERARTDRGYAAKIDLIEEFLRGHRGGGPILDIGANTAGEAEVLSERGWDIVATDINEVALGLSRKRSDRFGRRGPSYYAADAHRLPFQPETFGSVVAFEVLHHFEHLDAVLAELFRVLRPGGAVFAYEPYALNPYRRLAELRFVVMGSIERSFTVAGLGAAFDRAGFEIVSTERNFLPPSAWKKAGVSPFRAGLKELYYQVGRRALSVFGNIVMVARRPGRNQSGREDVTGVEARLQCPLTGAPLMRSGSCYEVTSGQGPRYPIVEGIPVLIPEDARSGSAGAG